MGKPTGRHINHYCVNKFSLLLLESKGAYRFMRTYLCNAISNFTPQRNKSALFEKTIAISNVSNRVINMLSYFAYFVNTVMSAKPVKFMEETNASDSKLVCNFCRRSASKRPFQETVLRLDTTTDICLFAPLGFCRRLSQQKVYWELRSLYLDASKTFFVHFYWVLNIGFFYVTIKNL